MIEMSLDDFIVHLKGIAAGEETVQASVLGDVAARMLEEVKANLPDNETGNILREHLRASIDGNQIVIGVENALVKVPGREELFDVGQAAVDLEFGTPDNPPEPFLGQAGFVHGEKAAAIVRDIIGAHIAGMPLAGLAKK